jgi:hypothetical protein
MNGGSTYQMTEKVHNTQTDLRSASYISKARFDTFESIHDGLP